MRLAILGLMSVLVLAACESAPPALQLPQITFAHLAPYRLNVARLDVVSDFKPPFAPPNVEHLVPVAPEAALRRWAQDRLRAEGAAGTARFAIRDATMTETPLPVATGVGGLFRRQQAVRIEATVSASLEVLDARGFRQGFADARASRSNTVGEEASLNDRDRARVELVEAVMKDLDAELDRQIRQYLGGFLF